MYHVKYLNLSFVSTNPESIDCILIGKQYHALSPLESYVDDWMNHLKFETLVVSDISQELDK